MKIHPILGAMALATALTLSSCLSFDTHDDDDHPASTTTVTKETVVPDPLYNPGLTQTTETTTTRTR